MNTYDARVAAVSSGSRWSTRIVGILGTVLLHAFYLEAVSLGASAAKSTRYPQETGPGASAILSSTGSWMTLVIVQLPGIDKSERLEDVASRGMAQASEAIQVVSPDPTPASELQDHAKTDASAPLTVGDPAVQSMLFGRYTGQINARIERAWRKPRSPINDENSALALTLTDGNVAPERDQFRCQARILQDTTGNVKEVALIVCNGTLAWQRSLIDAMPWNYQATLAALAGKGPEPPA